ncbi:MAG TPA: hypothetical protein VN607_02240 [Gemmatimonadaceae bacterium]|nr:hypothetical protein [Gemmatimonadaceae bacterium]
MSDETVRPALTAEEWQKLQCDEEAKPGVTLETVRLANDLEGRPMLVITHHQEADRWTALGTRQLHQAAALALHGQPFGPKSHWVEWLDTEIAIWERQEYVGAGVLVLRELRAFIAALLPPEPT